MNKFMMFVCVLSIVACGKKVPAKAPPAKPNQCVALDTCNANDQLVPEIVSQVLADLPPPEQGAKGDTGSQGETGLQGAQGLQGEKGFSGVAGPKGDTGDTGAQGLAGLQGATGLQGLTGLTGATGSQGATGPKGDTGLTGAQGPKGDAGPAGSPGQNGIGNTSALSATRIYSPAVADYVGTTTVTNATVFVPPIISVVYGNQNTGAAYVDFGTTRCSYLGNNKAGSALALYTFVSCKDDQGAVVPGLTPGQPFSYSGSITVSVGNGADMSVPTQVSVIMQINY